MGEEMRAVIEQKEDEFVAQTEEAVGVMKNVLDTPEPLRNLADLIAAQLEYHKKAYEILSELAPVVDGLQVEQEVGAEAVGAIITLMCLNPGQLSEEPRRRLNVMQAVSSELSNSMFFSRFQGSIAVFC
ncbi:MAG: hypothetical protein L6R42_009965 [Xanthoria sp. 1 TBL-2021]|nr:MAG: hypothetical protein L6R42_009965 [Xanthoria sp. 1 TBL-2021]